MMFAIIDVRQNVALVVIVDGDSKNSNNRYANKLMLACD